MDGGPLKSTRKMDLAKDGDNEKRIAKAEVCAEKRQKRTAASSDRKNF